MEDLSLHILDIVENSLEAEAKRVEIKVVEDIDKDLLSIEIRDDGRGMDEEMVQKASDPFVTTRTTRRVGLGLSLLAQAASMSNGGLSIRSKEEVGTIVSATFQHSHIDRKPLGNMADTIVTLIVGNPQIDFSYYHKKGDLEYSLDTQKIKAELEGLPINTPEVIGAIRESLRQGLEGIGAV